jgi:hypothetical protein
MTASNEKWRIEPAGAWGYMLVAPDGQELAYAGPENKARLEWVVAILNDNPREKQGR